MSRNATDALRGEAARPRLAAGVIPWRPGASGGCEIFWVKRSDSLRFMGGWHAFPGGRLSGTDAEVPTHGSPDGEEAFVASGPPAALPACALRELFEEAGILPVVGSLPTDGVLEEARARLLDGTLDLAGWLRSRGLSLDISRLAFAGRWVTPPLSPIRFDATFFLLEWPRSEGRQPTVVPGELTHGEWTSASRALRRWEDGDACLAQPTLETIRVLASDGAAGRGRLWKSEALRPDAPRSIEFRPGIRVIPLEARTLPPATHTNALLIGTGDLVLIDPGSDRPDELRDLERIVRREQRRAGGRLVGIWLTHHHPDHIAGTEAMRRRWSVPVWAHRATVRRSAADGVHVDRRFAGGELVRIPGRRELRVRVLHTPGHASGHLCFYEEGSQTLMCGDMVSGFGSVVISPPDGNMADYLRSLEVLRDLGAKAALPGHGTMMRDPAAAIEGARQHRLRRERLVLRAWRSGAREPEGMIGPVYGELEPAARPLAARQVLAHLERLEEIGRIAALPESLRARLAGHRPD